jgi:agmatine deiminase
MILSNETNKVYFSALLPSVYPVFFKRLKAVIEKYGVEVELLQDTEDYWCRDYMPIQVAEKRFVKYKYWPDYLNNDDDRKTITDVDKPWSHLGMDDTISLIDLGEIILDGGNVVKTPYHVIMTEKIFEENRHIDSDRLIARIEEAFQTEVLLVPWLGPKYDTFGHTDGLVRYIKDKDLLMDNYTVFDKAKAKQLYKALEGKGYTVHELELPYGYDYSWAYINFLQTYKVIVMPKFGLKADEYANKHISSLFDMPVVQIPAPHIIKEYGGAFNCLSWNIKV